MKILFKILFVASIIAILVGAAIFIAPVDYLETLNIIDPARSLDIGGVCIFAGIVGCLIFHLPKDVLGIETEMKIGGITAGGIFLAIMVACFILIPDFTTKLMSFTQSIESYFGLPLSHIFGLLTAALFTILCIALLILSFKKEH